MDYSDTAGASLLDISNKEWSQSILDTFEIDTTICPPLVKSTDQVGMLDSRIAAEIGFTNEIPFLLEELIMLLEQLERELLNLIRLWQV